MAGTKMTMREIDKKNVETMQRRAAYFKKHPAPKSDRPEIGKPTKWDKPAKTTKK